MESRFLFTRRGCPHCNKSIKAINKINLRLPIDKQIKIEDLSLLEEFNWDGKPIVDVFDKMGLKGGYPLLYIDGIRIEPSATPEQLFILLKAFLKEDLLY